MVGGLRKRSGGSTSRLRGGAGSSTGVDLSHPNSSRALAATSIVAAPAAGGRTAAGGGMDADSRKAQVASPVGAQESGPWEKSAARAGRGHETKQGSRRPGSEDDGGDRYVTPVISLYNCFDFERVLSSCCVTRPTPKGVDLPTPKGVEWRPKQMG